MAQQGEQRPTPPAGVPPEQAVRMPGAPQIAPPKGAPAPGRPGAPMLGSSASAGALGSGAGAAALPLRGEAPTKYTYRGHDEWEYEKIPFAPDLIKMERGGLRSRGKKEGRKEAPQHPSRIASSSIGSTSKLTSLNGIYGRLGAAKSLTKVQSLPTISSRSHGTGQREAQALIHGS